MSVFTTIIKDLKSFASKIETAFKKLFNELPSWTAIVSGAITYVGPIVIAIVSLLNPAEGSELATLLNSIKTKLATISALATSGSNATGIASALTDLQEDIPTLLSLVQVSNPTLVSKVETYANTILAELQALIVAVPEVVATVTTSTAPAVATPTVPTSVTNASL
jgi:hypothetical protein